MIITCKQCATEYFLDEDRIKPSGSKVKCSNCQHLFVAFPPAVGDSESLAEPAQVSGTAPASEQIPESSAVSSLADLDNTGIPDPSVGLADFTETDADEDQAMDDLTNELDKILGSDEMSGQPAADTDDDLIIGADETGLTQGENLDVDLLDDELDDLFGGQADETEDTPAGYDADIEILDLSELDDDVEETSALETTADTGSDTAADDDSLLPENGIDLDSIEIDDLGPETDAPAKPDRFSNKKLAAGIGAASAAAAALAGSDDIDMADLTAGLDELLGPGSSAPASTETPSDKTVPETPEVVETEDGEIDALTDELDVILGSDTVEDQPVENIVEDPGVYDSSVDKLDLSELDVELDEMFTPQLAADGSDDKTGEQASQTEDEIDLDTIQIQELDSEIDKIEEITLRAKDETEIQDLSALGIELEDLEIPDDVTADEAGLKIESDPENIDILDTKQIDNLNLELEDLSTLEKDRSAAADDISLDTQQIEDLDLEFDNLDLDDQDSGESGDVAKGLKDDSEDNDDFILETSQVDALDLELEDIETDEPGADAETSFDKDANISLDTKKGKQAEVLNVNLERPDLDGGFSKADEIDLPILDELLAPAEVVDESLLEGDDADGLTFPADEKISEESFLELEEEDPPVEDAKTPEKQQFPIEPESPDMEEVEMQMTDKNGLDIQPDAITDSKQKELPRVDKDAPRGTTTDTDTFVPATSTASAAAYPAKKGRKSIIALLLIALLAAGLYAVTSLGIKVPFISDLLGSNRQQVVNDQGAAQLKTLGIDSKFITSKKSGNLFVITGKIMNQYDHARTAVLIKGSIFSKGGKLVRAKSVYGGNILSDKDLATKPFADIQKYLSNNAGNGNAGSLKIEPGKTLPFMIVLDNLPADIEEYAVKIIKSSAI